MWEALRFYNSAPEPDQYSLPFKEASPSTFSNPALGKRGEKRTRSEPNEDLKRVRLRHELETFGFHLSVHPLDLYAHTLKRVRCVPAKDLPAFVGKRVTTMGWVVTGKTVHTRDGDEMKFVSFEDTTGIYETVFFPKTFSRFCHMLNAFRPFILKGTVQETFGAVTLTVTEWAGIQRLIGRRSIQWSVRTVNSTKMSIMSFKATKMNYHMDEYNVQKQYVSYGIDFD